MNLRLPDHNSRALFFDTVRVRGLSGEKKSPPAEAGAPAHTTWLREAETRLVSRNRLHLLTPVLQQTRYWEHTKFYFIRGSFLEGPPYGFAGTMGFAGTARTIDGKWQATRGELITYWRRDDTPVADWRIDGVEINWMDSTTSDDLIFEDRLTHVLARKSDRRRATISKHWQLALNHYYPKRAAKANSEFDDKRFFPIATANHPALAVVDLDRDGWDDLYVTQRWGTNLFFRNQGTGRFVEAAAEYGLNLPGRSNAAILADFDNDGDTDAFVARGLARSVYLRNNEGQFIDCSSSHVDSPLPYEATSLTAVDYNNDGLLDIYICTYHNEDVSRRIDADLSHPDHRIHKTLSKAHSEELKRRVRSENRSYINQIGPPNILLVNRGAGRFEVASENDQVAVWRNSFQAAWCDFDDDGDQDLYVANDFAADCLLRNDGKAGFTNVTAQQGLRALGFAMGVTWGDYNNDGRPDLYVSNMFSKAGTRITQQIDGIDDRIQDLARGNYLYRGTHSGFKQVSGKPNTDHPVAHAGWSWGGQFADLNNDGFLDLYVSSGYFTAPRDFETDVDL